MNSRRALAVVVVALLSACASSGDMKALPISSNVSLLKKVETTSVDAAYVRLNLDLGKYKTVWIEWPRVDYLRDPPHMTRVRRETLEALRQFFHDAMVKALQDGYEVVTSANPDSLQIRTTIIGVAGSSNAFRTEGGGWAAIEGEYRDVTTGRMLAAFADKRGGGGLAPALSEWADAQGAFAYWAKLIRRHLDKMRGEGRGIF